MFTIHVISDLNLKFNEFTPPEEQILPDVDLVILNDNIGSLMKRGFFYTEELCAKYPDTQFVYNLGFNDLFALSHLPKNDNELVKAIETRSKFNKDWPKNLHSFYDRSKLIQLRNGETVDIFCSFGFPKILNYEGAWEDHIWWRNIIYDVTMDIDDPRCILPKDSSRVKHGLIPLWATQEWINRKHDEEQQLITAWCSNTTYSKILVTTINPVNDTRCYKQAIQSFDVNINGLWVTSNSEIDTIYNGVRLISNPGRGETKRSSVISM